MIDCLRENSFSRRQSIILLANSGLILAGSRALVMFTMFACCSVSNSKNWGFFTAEEKGGDEIGTFGLMD